MALTTAQKLKIKEGEVVLILNAPPEFKKNIGPLPAGVKIITEGKNCNQVHWFVTTKAQLDKEFKKVLPLIKDNIICWIYYPKGTSKIQTDLTRDKGWETLLAHNDTLAWINLVAFDETWSAFGCRAITQADKNKQQNPKKNALSFNTLMLPPKQSVCRKILQLHLKKTNQPRGSLIHSLFLTAKNMWNGL